MASKLERFPIGKKLGNKKRKLYFALTVLMVLALAAMAISLHHASEERRNAEYVQKARESINAGDYENALLYLRRVKDADKDVDVLIMMADCYDAMGNYPRALETLRKLNTGDPAIADRIQTIEQRKLQQSQSTLISVGGKEFEESTQTASMNQMGLTDADLAAVTHLYALDVLSLENNRITDVRELCRLGGLDELNLAGNHIRDVSPLAELTGLRVLNLDRNPITDCSALVNLRYLSSLSVTETEIEESALYQLSDTLPGCAIRYGNKGDERILLAGEVFSLNTTELSLRERALTDISMLKNFSELRILDISGNEISDLQPLMELSKLERLDISHNYIGDLRPLIGLPLLTRLEAADNAIIETSAVGSVEHLTELDLSGNSIRDFSGLGHLEQLKILNLSDTGISDADLTALYTLKSIYSIDLRSNAGLSDIAIGSLKSALPGCGISTSELVYEVDFAGHLLRSDEKKIAFPSGGISDLSGLSKMTCLEEIDLKNNEIVSLFPFEITPSCATLKRVNLANNRIMDVLSLYALANLEELDLSGNQIGTVASLRKLTTLKRLNLTGNPIPDDAIQDLRGWLPDCEILF